VDFAESDERRAPRPAVAGIAAKFGPRYHAGHAAGRGPWSGLWQAGEMILTYVALHGAGLVRSYRES